jgi:hypothetical protein
MTGDPFGESSTTINSLTVQLLAVYIRGSCAAICEKAGPERLLQARLGFRGPQLEERTNAPTPGGEECRRALRLCRLASTAFGGVENCTGVTAAGLVGVEDCDQTSAQSHGAIGVQPPQDRGDDGTDGARAGKQTDHGNAPHNLRGEVGLVGITGGPSFSPSQTL